MTLKVKLAYRTKWDELKLPRSQGQQYTLEDLCTGFVSIHVLTTYGSYVLLKAQPFDNLIGEPGSELRRLQVIPTPLEQFYKCVLSRHSLSQSLGS